MKQLKYLLVLPIAVITVLTSCEKDELKDNIEPQDNLEQFGILGKWTLESRDYGGISSGAVIIGYALEFQKDSISTDLKGLFRVIQPGYEANGVFELDNLNQTIELDYDNNQNLYEIEILETAIVLSYLDDNNLPITEWWRKQ